MFPKDDNVCVLRVCTTCCKLMANMRFIRSKPYNKHSNNNNNNTEQTQYRGYLAVTSY